MKDSVIQARSVTKTYSSEGDIVHALDDFSIDLYKGEFTVIMGASGSGKSTLLYNLSGLDRPCSGEVIFNNESIHLKNETQLSMLRRKNFGFIFQNINLVPNLTVLENMLVPGGLVNRKGNEVLEKARGLLKIMDIGELERRLPHQLSGGQQQRAAIARALINDPEIIFADEPTGTLNFSSSRTILKHLYRISTEGQTIAMVTHDIKTASWGNRILFIRDGKLHGEFTYPASLADVENQLEEREKVLFAWLSEKGW